MARAQSGEAGMGVCADEEIIAIDVMSGKINKVEAGLIFITLNLFLVFIPG